MAGKPETNQVEAAAQTANELFVSFSQMDNVALDLQIVNARDAVDTNSGDGEFLDDLLAGKYLSDDHLANAS